MIELHTQTNNNTPAYAFTHGKLDVAASSAMAPTHMCGDFNTTKSQMVVLQTTAGGMEKLEPTNKRAHEQHIHTVYAQGRFFNIPS